MINRLPLLFLLLSCCSMRAVPIPQGETTFNPYSDIVFDQHGKMHFGLETTFTAQARQPFNSAMITRAIPAGYTSLEFRSINIGMLPDKDGAWSVILVLVYLERGPNDRGVPVIAQSVRAQGGVVNVNIPNLTAELHNATAITVWVQEISLGGLSNVEINATGRLE